MNRRDRTGRFTRTGTALAVRDPWVDGFEADWKITSAWAATQVPRFDCINPGADAEFLAGIDRDIRVLGAELDAQVQRAREDMDCIGLDWHRRHVNGIRHAALPPAPDRRARAAAGRRGAR